jgi:hypothetical protein
MREMTSKIGSHIYKLYKFAYKKTKDNCKFEDMFQENGHFSIAFTQNSR